MPTPRYKTGDIIIFKHDPFGHVGMCHTSGNHEAKFIHAQLSGDFHISQQKEQHGNSFTYFVDGNLWHFRPRPDKMGSGKQDKLKEVADAIKKSAKYGVYRAIRLYVGSSTYGKKAKKRLTKYKSRESSTSEKFVSTITCAEAVILCYQVAFNEGDELFIKKDAAHTMPYTLAQYLETDAASHWEKLQSPRRKQ